MKYIVIVPDGMADEPVDELGGRTPLEAAHTTNMDYMAQHGMIGLIQTIPDKMSPGSDIGNMSLLGYDPRKYHTGRAPLEAANMNIILKDDEIAFRCNLTTIQDNIMADYSAGHITTPEADILIKELNEKLGSKDIRFHTGKSYRHLMILRTNSVKDFMQIKTTPPHDILAKGVEPFLPKGEGSAMLWDLMDRSQKILEAHPVNQVRIDLKQNPANKIWLWGQGSRPKFPSFKTQYGVEGSIISAVDLVNGIGRLAGLEIIDVPGATGYYDTNYLGKAEYGLRSLKDKDFVYIHIESTDEAGHNGDWKEKVKAIERIDKDIVGTVLNHFSKYDDVRVIVLPDHPTPIRKRTHTSDPVGFVMYGKGIAGSGVEKFSEKTCAEKGLRFNSGEQMMQFLMERK